ncbi:MAG TPA: LysR substrate-binding domain-containing protein [Xanthobacteraceae bacterium]|jgi:LysR family transcriptional regulator, nitrogen assimilation regulatory protein|nr:LysR substrate-binding domain-containing protein [Xanthobacteraceae bacterium]
MDLRQLRYFVGIVQAGSLSRAADQLRVAQSAISHHLASLESELDRQLVTRGPKGIQLTEAGGVLYRHAQAILRHLDVAKQDAMTALTVPSGRVTIGIPGVLAPLLSYELFMRVRTEYPQILLHVSDANSWLLRERLVNGRLDIAVLYADQSVRGLAVEPLASEELFYITADPDTSPICIADAARRPLLLPGPGSVCRRVAEEAFKRHGLTVTSIGEINTLGTLRRAITSGVGNAILSWAALYDGEETIALNCRRFADAELVRPVALCFPEVAQRSPAIEAVAATLKSLVHELVENGIWQGVSLIDPAAKESRAAMAN